MEDTYKNKVFETVKASGKNGMTINEIVEKTGYEKRVVYRAINGQMNFYHFTWVRNVKVYYAKEQRVIRRGDLKTIYEKALERLKNGEALNQYWRGEKSDIDDYGDAYLLHAIQRLWMKGEPIIRRKRTDGLWEYIYVKQENTEI